MIIEAVTAILIIIDHQDNKEGLLAQFRGPAGADICQMTKGVVGLQIIRQDDQGRYELICREKSK